MQYTRSNEKAPFRKIVLKETIESWKNTINLLEIRFAFQVRKRTKSLQCSSSGARRKSPSASLFCTIPFLSVKLYLVQKELQKKHHYVQRKRNKKLKRSNSKTSQKLKQNKRHIPQDLFWSPRKCKKLHNKTQW